jgi:hypothetical protein
MKSILVFLPDFSHSYVMKRFLFLFLCLVSTDTALGQSPENVRPRVLVSTDIGGTDPDDNQSMIHLLMYNDLFDLEGLVSSPSFGQGSKEEILRMIDLYEQDYPQLLAHNGSLRKPSALRELCKQGRRGLSPYKGYGEPTEGSNWIVRCARKPSDRPLWVLVWGTTEDLAQALHDAPDIAEKIRVYYIGGPNKKWGSNSYAYIARNFPNLWIIENNSSYRGFITDNKRLELIETFDGLDTRGSRYREGYYEYAIQGTGAMGAAFKDWYKGIVKMGDTPSLLYMMDGDPEDPTKECPGGSFERTEFSPRRVLYRTLSEERDTIPVYAVMEFHLKGPILDIPEDSACFRMTIAGQVWQGYYLGRGDYALRYAPKEPGLLTYVVESNIPALNGICGSFVVAPCWPEKPSEEDYLLGANWYSDRRDPGLFEGNWQGAASVSRWRNEVLKDWAQRWAWLKNQ